MAAKATTIVTKQTSIGADTQSQPNAPPISISIDTTIQETHRGANTVTDHPVEEGANISDHSRPEPDGLVMECIISNSPISASQVAQAVRAGQVTVQSTAPQQTPGRAEAAYEDLLKLKNQGLLCAVVTTLKTYRSMVVVDVTLPRTAQESNAVHFTVTFKKIVVVQNKLTKVVVSKSPKAQPRQKLGNTTPQSTDADDSAAFKGLENAKDKQGTFGKLGGFAAGALGIQ